jgi:hypothetical protein
MIHTWFGTGQVPNRGPAMVRETERPGDICTCVRVRWRRMVGVTVLRASSTLLESGVTLAPRGWPPSRPLSYSFSGFSATPRPPVRVSTSAPLFCASLCLGTFDGRYKNRRSAPSDLWTMHLASAAGESAADYEVSFRLALKRLTSSSSGSSNRKLGGL